MDYGSSTPSTKHEHSIYIIGCTCYVGIVSELLLWWGVGIEERGGYGGEVGGKDNLFQMVIPPF